MDSDAWRFHGHLEGAADLAESGPLECVLRVVSGRHVVRVMAVRGSHERGKAAGDHGDYEHEHHLLDDC